MTETMNETLLYQVKAISDELMDITSSTDITKEITRVENLTQLRDDLLKLSSLKANVNHIMPDAQYNYDKALGVATEDIMVKYKDDIKGNSSLYKNLITGRTKDERRILEFTNRINSTIERASENLRSYLSSVRKEMEMH